MNSSANNFLFHNIIFTELKALGGTLRCPQASFSFSPFLNQSAITLMKEAVPHL